MWQSPKARFFLAIPALLVLSAGSPLAQEGWDNIDTPPAAAPSASIGSLSLGAEVGKPLIFGVAAGYNFTPHTSGHFGFSSLSDFSAILGEVRLYPLGFIMEQALPSVGVGFTQYFLTVGERDTSPTAGHVLAGLEYIFPSQLGVGMTLGYQLTIGSSQDRTVERYGINDDLSEWFFAVKGRYFF